MSSKNFMSYEDATTVLGAYAEAIKNTVKDVKVDGKSCLDSNRNAIVQITVPTEYEYTVAKVDNLNLKVTTKQNDVVTDETNYTLTGWSDPVNINGHIELNYGDGLWVVKTLKVSTSYPAEQTWSWLYMQTPSVPVLTFEEAENHIGLSAAYADLKEHKQDKLTFDNVPTENSNNPVKSGGVYSALAGKQDTLTFDDTPTDNSNNPVKSNGIYDALADKQDATDNSLETEAKTIVGAINEHEGDISTLKSGLTDLDNEVNGDATTYPYADVITINDAIPVNLAECNVKIEPVQNLHGYSNPWVGGAGKNKLPLVLADIKSANTDGTWSGNAYTINGVTFTVITDSDGNVTGIKVTGTASADTSLNLPVATLTVGTSYILSGCPANGGDSTYRIVYYNSAIGARADVGSGKSISYQTGTGESCFIQILNGYVISADGLMFYPMIRLSTETDATFAPYTNICPITGHTEASVQRDGKNLWNGKFVSNSFVESDTYDSTYCYAGNNAMPIIAGNKYTFSVDGVDRQMRYLFLDENKEGLTEATNAITTTAAPQNAKYLQWKYLLTTGTEKCQIETGETATPYEPYQGKTYTIALGDTIYGGTVNFDSGVMTVDRAYFAPASVTDIDNNATMPTDNWLVVVTDGKSSGGIISNQYVKGGASTAGNCGITNSGKIRVKTYQTYNSKADAFDGELSGSEFVYELATPTTIQLTPKQIQLLKGTNTLTASTGQISVTVNGVSGSIGAVQEQIDDLQGKVAEVQSNLTSLHIHKVVESLTTGTVSDKLLSLKTAYNNLTADQRKTAILVKNDQDQYIPLNNTGEFFVIFVNMSTTLFITINIQNGTSIIEQDGTKSDQSSLTNSDKYSIWVME